VCRSFCVLNIVSINVATRSDLGIVLAEVEKFKADVVCLQELRQTQSLPLQVNTLNSGLDRANKILKTNAAAVFLKSRVGLIILNHAIRIRSVIIQDRFIRVSGEIRYEKLDTDNQSTTITRPIIIYSVYAPAQEDERRDFFANDVLCLRELPTDDTTVIIIGGDFNDYLSPQMDRDPPIEGDNVRMTRQHRHWFNLLEPRLILMNLVDAFRAKYPVRREFSHSDARGRGTSSRIDTIIVSENIASQIHSMNYVANTFSDHKYVVLKMKPEKTRHCPDDVLEYMLPWRLHPDNCFDFHFREQCKNYASDLLGTMNRPFKMSDWLQYKLRLQQYARETSRRFGYLNKDPLSQIRRLRREIEETQDEVQLNYKYFQLEKFRQMYKAGQEKILQRPLIWEQLDEESPFPRHRRRTVTNLVLTEGPTTTETGLQRSTTDAIVTGFYQKLFSPEVAFDAARARVFLEQSISDENKLARAQYLELMKPFEVQEVQNALHGCRDRKVPGFDGLSYEFYKMLSEVVAEPFSEMCTSTLIGNQDALEIGMGVQVAWPLIKGMLLPKKGNLKDIRNYRPVSIMDADLRWRERILQTWIQGIRDTILTPEQTGFLEGRTSLDNIATLMLAIEHARYTEEPFILISLDQEKAYDRVGWEWLFSVLRFMNFPEDLIKMVQITYKGPAIQFIVNGQRTREIALGRGILQGGPLSVLLYILSLQPLVSMLIKEGLGIHITYEINTYLKLMAYADDLLVIITSLELYRKLCEALEEYGKLSDARFNPLKSLVIIPHGKEPSWVDEIKEKRVIKEGDFKYLGYFLRLDGGIPVDFLTALLGRMRTSCYIWEVRNLKFRSRCQTVNCNVLPLVWHAVTVCPLPQNFVADLRRTITPYIFRTVQCPIEFKLACYPKQLGGLGIIYPDSMVIANMGQLVARAFSNQSVNAESFRLSFIREIEGAGRGGSFFRLFSKGMFHRKEHMSPFWARVYSTVQNLGLTINEDWESYTDEEILSIPYELPQLMSDEMAQKFAKRIRPDLIYLRIVLLRDILVWNDRLDPHLTFCSPERGFTLIRNRMREIRPEDDFKPWENTDQNYVYAGARSAFAALRGLWPTIWEQFPKGFRERLMRVRKPTSDSFLAPLRQEAGWFSAKELHGLITWNKLELAKMPCKDFKIRSVRKHLLSPKLIIPS